MELHDYNKIQINYTVRKDSDENVIDRSTMVNIRCDSTAEAIDLYKDIKARLNGDLAPHKASLANNDAPAEAGKDCPQCGGRLILRSSKTGQFYGCSKYPKCRYTEQV